MRMRITPDPNWRNGWKYATKALKNEPTDAWLDSVLNDTAIYPNKAPLFAAAVKAAVIAYKTRIALPALSTGD